MNLNELKKSADATKAAAFGTNLYNRRLAKYRARQALKLYGLWLELRAAKNQLTKSK